MNIELNLRAASGATAEVVLVADDAVRAGWQSLIYDNMNVARALGCQTREQALESAVRAAREVIRTDALLLPGEWEDAHSVLAAAEAAG